jgi:hypothetical protein
MLQLIIFRSNLIWSWGWEFDLRFDSLPRLDFKGVVCMLITLDPPVAKLAYKNEHQSPYNKAHACHWGLDLNPAKVRCHPHFPFLDKS